jgi:predicted PurR-regulated permease PerM
MTDVQEDRPEWRGSTAAAPPTTTTIVVGVVLVGVLYLGREVLVPLALAVLMSFVLAPPVRLLQRIRLPRIVAVLMVVLVAFSAVFALGGLMVSQVNQLAGELPRYQFTLREKIQALRGAAAGSSTLERASEVLQDLGKELERPSRTTIPSGAGPTPERPIPVEVRQPDPGALQTLAALVAPLIHPLTTTGIVIIFVVFILMQQQDLRNRLVRLAGSHDLHRTTAAMDEAGERLSRLFLMQLLLNASFGLVIGVGLWLIGVPSAPLWGMLAMILRFIPYIGALISAVFPLVLAAAVGSGWSMLVWTAALFLVSEPIVGHVIEPLVYGHSSGLSPVAVVASATFWTWLWGPIGLILATPLTICLVVIGRHVERLKFLEVMLGSKPALTPEQQVYQRMLAGDPIEASDQAQAFLKEKPLVDYYDTVLMSGLKLAQADAERGSLDRERMQRIRDVVCEIVDDLETHEDVAAEAATAKEESALARLKEVEMPHDEIRVDARWQAERAVLCVPGIGLLDESVAMPLAQLIRRRGIGAHAAEADALSMAKLFTLETEGVILVCLCYLENATPAQVHYAARRIRRKAPHARVLVALFGGSEKLGGPQLPDSFAGLDLVGGALRDAVERVADFARDSAADHSQPDTSLPPAARSA